MVNWKRQLCMVLICLCIVPGTTTQAASKKIKITNVGKTYTLYKGKKKKLHAEILKKSWKKKKIVWSSGYSKVAAVTKSGTVTAKKNGTATITARVKGTKQKATCKITVKTKVSKVYVSSSKKAIAIGSSYTRKATISPKTASNKKVKYSSSNKSIAKVSSSGKVTAKTAGTATITVKATDGSGKKDTYKVRVIKKVSKSENRFIAHRGYSSIAPENSLPAFKAAGQAGFYGLECDIYETQPEVDGDDTTREFIIMHDETLNRMCGISGADVDQTKLTLSSMLEKYYIKSGNNVKNYTKEELKIPTLDEYLDVCSQYNVVPVIEIKQNLSEEAVHRLYLDLEEKNMVSQAIIISDYRSPLEYMRQENSTIQMQYILRDVDSDDINWMKKYEVDADCKYTLLTSSVIKNLHNNGIRVNVWTINSLENVYDFNRYGVDYITSNKKVFY